MSVEYTPGKTPKPNPLAFSTGIMKKKQLYEGERSSVPSHLATPETPSKSQRSKFIMPTSLSPFALSPKNLPGASEIALSTPAARTKLSTSYSAPIDMSDSDPSLSDLRDTRFSAGNATRSSSPILKINGPDDLFSFGMDLADYDEMGSDGEEDPNNPFSSPQKPILLDDSGNFKYNLPWKSTNPAIFDKAFFEDPEWRLVHHSSPGTIDELLWPIESVVSHFEDSFEALEILGSGSFSEVFKVRRKKFDPSNRHNHHLYALKRSKVPFSGMADRERRLEEVSNLWLASENPHCIQIIESWEQHGYLYILMELCENGSLKDVIQYMSQTQTRFTEYQIWQILNQICQGLRHIHSMSIVHLDLKPANILIDHNGILKIGDFGLSRNRNSSAHYDPDAEGDKYYMAPETLEGCYEAPADIFSLGLLILELAADIELPSQGLSWQNLRHGNFSDLNFEEISDDLHSLITNMTDPDPHKRPNIDEILGRVERQSQLLISKSP